jgi:hypothetical protein
VPRLRFVPACVLCVALLGAALATAAAPATAAAAGTSAPTRVLLAFLPVDEHPAKDELPGPPILDELATRESLSLGLDGAIQGGYSQVQAVLDMTQGTRVSAAAYKPSRTPQLVFYATGDGALFQGWLDARARGESAPADIVPGMLGQSVPGGAAYAGVKGRSQIEAVVAANEAGRIGQVSLGHADDIAARARALLAEHRLVVVGLPTRTPGALALDELVRERTPDELIIAVQSPPDVRAPQLLPTGILGLGGPGALTSETTHLPGVVAGIDIAPTVLRWLGVPVPSAMKGQPVRVDGTRDAAALQSLSDRLRVVGPRRFPALFTLLAACLTIGLLLGILGDRRGVRAALRISGLAFLWVLPVLLLTAALAPSRVSELVIVTATTLLLAVLTDRFVAWPRAPMVPGLATMVVYCVDLAMGSELIIRSLLGPNPRFGSRYYGLGNELEATLPVLLLMALAALLDRRVRSRGTALTFALCSLALGAVVGSGRLGADVGGVITVGAGGAVATLCMLPGGITRRAIGVALLVPVLAVGGLAVLDLATGGDSHFTRTVLHAHGGSALQDIVVRRYELAFKQLVRGLMPFGTLIAVLTIAYTLRYRERVFAPLEGRPAWTAAFAGSLASAIAGALANDSGPVLLVFGVFTMGAALAYVRGDARLALGVPEAARPSGLGVPEPATWAPQAGPPSDRAAT